MSDYNLTTKQQEIWATQVGPLPRGIQKKIAEALSKKHGDVDGWRTRLSQFFQGKEAALRAVFEHEGRLRIVADGLKRTPRDLQGWLQAARGVPLADGPFDMRVPGFEDLGALPVLDAFYAPPQRETRFHLPSVGNMSNSAGGLVDLNELVGVAARNVGDAARVIVVVGSPGQGRTPLMKALGARMAEMDLDPAPWAAGGVAEGAVVIADDIDLMTPVARARLLAEVVEARATLLATTGEQDAMMDLPGERVVCALKEGDETWACGYLEHVQKVLASRWSRRVDLGPLQDWLRDDPYALGLGARADTLGFLARHVAEGATVPVRHLDFLAVALQRWVRLLRAEDQAAEALALDLAGPRVFARAAALACISGVMRVPISSFCRLFVEELGGIAGDARGVWADTAPLGMVRLVEALVGVGLLHQEGDGVRPAQEAFFVAALGRELVVRLDDQELLRAVVLDQRWHPALVAAAEVIRDPSPVLAAIEKLPRSTRCLAMQAVTRLLTAAPRPSEPVAFNAAFRRVLWWWLHRRADPRSVTFTFGGPNRPEAPSRPQSLIGGVAPLIALGMVSRAHADVLGPVDDLACGDGEWDRDQAAYGELLRQGTPDPHATRVGLVLAAPFQSRWILEPECWSALPGSAQRGTDLPGGIIREEFALWWRTVGAERLRREADGDRLIAGTAPGWSITWAMAQVGKGVEVWAGALSRRIAADDPESARAFADAVVSTLQWGGTANLGGVKQVWEGIRSARKLATLRAFVAGALPRPPERWVFTPEIVTWVLKELVTDSTRDELWDAWVNAPSQIRSIPWKSFLDAGLDEQVAAQWAIGTLPEITRANGPSAEPVHTDGGGVAFQLFEAEDPPQSKVLDHLVLNGGLVTLKLLLRAPPNWARGALKRIQAEHPAVYRHLLLEHAAKSHGEERLTILHQLTPEPGEQEIWEQIVRTSESWSERLVRFCQLSLAKGPCPGRWDEALGALQVLSSVQVGGEVGLARFAAVFGYIASDAEQVDEGDAREEVTSAFAAASEELLSSFLQVLADIGDVLDWALHEDDAADLRDLVRGCFESEELRPHILGGFHQSWWRLAWHLLGKDFVVEKLAEGHADRPNGEATRWRLDALTNAGFFDALVFPLAQHEMLGDQAVAVIAARIVGTRADLMLKALESRPLVIDNQPVPSTLALARRLAQADPERAVDWLRSRASELTGRVTRDWWGALAIIMPVGKDRDDALAEWLRSDCA